MKGQEPQCGACPFGNLLHFKVRESGQRLLDIGNDIIDILDTNGETDKIRSHAACDQFFVGELTVRGIGGVKNAGVRVSNVAIIATLSFFMNASAADLPPLSPKDMTPQVPFGIYF